MDVRRARGWWATAIVGALAVLCVAAGLAALALRPPPLRTYEDLVIYALERRDVRYRQVALGEMWPDQINRQYGERAGPISMPVQIILADGAEAAGWLACAQPERGCRVTIEALGLRNEALPDMRGAELPPWLAWLEQRAAELGLSAP
jgi:hypothetical protein